MKGLILVLMLGVAVCAYSQDQPSPRVDVASFTRLDSSTTTYAAGDIMRAAKTTGGAVSFVVSYPRSVAKGGIVRSGYLTSVMLSADTCNVTGGTFDLVVMDDTAGIGAALAADNAAFQLASTFSGKVLGVIDGLTFNTYGTTAGGAGRSYANRQNINLPFTETTARKLYFVLVAQGAYKPKAAGTFTLRVSFEI